MIPDCLEKQFETVFSAAAGRLAAAGFTKRRMAFRKHVGANVAIIEFQRSRGNDATKLGFTLNLAVVSAAVAAKEGTTVNALAAAEGHLRLRIGQLTDERSDFWWSLDPRADEVAVANDVIDKLEISAIPYLASHSSDAALRKLWETGQSPGLTEIQRRRYLSAL